MTDTFYRGCYVLCTIHVWEHGENLPQTKTRAGLCLYQYANGWIVAMLAGGFRTVLNENMRRATPHEVAKIEADWQEADASMERATSGDADKLLDEMVAQVVDVHTGQGKLDV